MHGKNMIGSELCGSGTKTFRAFDPRAGRQLDQPFHEATQAELDRALELADSAAVEMRHMEPERIAAFLMSVREEILGVGDELIETASRETALDTGRLQGERDRTVNQIKMFVDIVKEGSWVDARIDTALPDRKPLPRPDIRRMLEPIGPIAVFGASNFPLAFSVAGGDTASAFAAGNPVVVKAHPAHPATSELVGMAIARAVKSRSMPEGTFSMLHSFGTEISIALATHPKTRAVAFTGSYRAGRALFDAAAKRPNPIPVYAEMGSVNPVFLLPSVLKSNGAGIAEGLFRSVLLGVGQFCTSPGLVFGVEGDGLRGFSSKLKETFQQASPGTMLNAAISKGYSDKLNSVAQIEGVESQLSSRPSDAKHAEGHPALFSTNAETWLRHKELHEEIFGPATILVHCGSQAELLDAARALEGTLTATIHGSPDELAKNSELIDLLSRKAGRLIFNGFPTGVEVGYAMHHGGPFPATTDEKFTSVGATAIYRFARPICYQNFPEEVLPAELRNSNPRGIWRTVNGQLTRDPV